MSARPLTRRDSAAEWSGWWVTPDFPGNSEFILHASSSVAHPAEVLRSTLTGTRSNTFRLIGAVWSVPRPASLRGVCLREGDSQRPQSLML